MPWKTESFYEWLGFFLFLAFDKHFSHAFFNKEVSNRCSYHIVLIVENMIKMLLTK